MEFKVELKGSTGTGKTNFMELVKTLVSDIYEIEQIYEHTYTVRLKR